MARTGPLWQEATLEIGIGQTLLHLGVHRWIDEVEHGEQATERVPETCIGKHVTWQHLAVVRTVMDYLAIGVFLIEAARKQYRAVKA